MVLVVVEPPVDKFGKILRKGRQALNSKFKFTKRTLGVCVRLLLQRQRQVGRGQGEPEGRNDLKEGPFHPQNDVLPQSSTNIFNLHSRLPHMQANEQNLMQGFPTYDRDSLPRDFSYDCTFTTVLVDQFGGLLDIPLRSHFRRFPGEGFGKVIDGYSFENNGQPLIVSGSNEGPVLRWFIVLAMNRSYYSTHFDANISVSCDFRPGIDPSRELLVAAQLQILNRRDRSHVSRVCPNGFQRVSNSTIARFNVPDVLSLKSLRSVSEQLIHDNLHVRFRVRLTCFQTYNNDPKLENEIWSEVRKSSRSELNMELPGPPATCYTLNGAMQVEMNVLERLPRNLRQHVICGSANLRNYSTSTFLSLLRFACFGKVNPCWRLRELIEIIQMCQEYEESLLKRYCLAALVGNHLNSDNAAQIAVVCFVYSAGTKLTEKLREYFIRNLKLIKKFRDMKQFVKNYPEAFVEILFGHPGKIHRDSSQDFIPFNQFLGKRFSSLANATVKNTAP